jgi:Zn-dependent protease with chaperone function
MKLRMNGKNTFGHFKPTIPFLMLSVFLLNTSCSTLETYTNGVINPQKLAYKAADKVLTPKEDDLNFPTNPLGDTQILVYVKKVRSQVETHAIHKGMSINLIKTARVQGQSGGNEICITRGMLNMMGDEAELACLLGHEIGHADMNHHFIKEEGFLGRLSGETLDAVGTKMNSTAIAEANKHRREIMLASRSQADEQAADEYGAVLAAKAGYDPYAFCRLFDRLAQKVNGDILYHVGSLTATHKTLDVRSSHLRGYLKSRGYQPGKGFHKEKEFKTATADLAGIHTGEGGNAGQRGVRTEDQNQDIQDLTDIKNELLRDQREGIRPEPKRFTEIMQRYSQYIRKNHITREQLTEATQGSKTLLEKASSVSRPGHFMAETVYQDSIFDPSDEEGLGPAGKQLLAGLDLVAKLCLAAAAPEVLMPIMAYEAVIGQDFFTGTELTREQRVISGLGAFVVAAGEAVKLETALEGIASADSETVQILKESGDIESTGTNWVLHSSDNINAELKASDGYIHPPYEAETRVYEYETTSEEKYFRVHLQKNQKGWWLIDFDPNEYSAQELKNMLSLPYLPTEYSEVVVRAGTKLRVGIAGAIDGWGRGGTMQFEIVDGRNADTTFKWVGILK